MTTKKFKDLDKVSNEDLTMWINKMLRGKRLSINGINFHSNKTIVIESICDTFEGLDVCVKNSDEVIASLVFNAKTAVMQVADSFVEIYDSNFFDWADKDLVSTEEVWNVTN